jgi:hypothetical protein
MSPLLNNPDYYVDEGHGRPLPTGAKLAGLLLLLYAQMEVDARRQLKQGRAVDVYDPDGHLDAWITDDILEDFGLYREHPDSTSTWCHLTDRAPGSGHRTFWP